MFNANLSCIHNDSLVDMLELGSAHSSQLGAGLPNCRMEARQYISLLWHLPCVVCGYDWLVCISCSC